MTQTEGFIIQIEVKTFMINGYLVKVKNWKGEFIHCLTIIHKNKYYNKLSNDILAKLTGCKNDIDKFGPSYLTSIDSLSKEDIKGFK